MKFYRLETGRNYNGATKAQAMLHDQRAYKIRGFASPGPMVKRMQQRPIGFFLCCDVRKHDSRGRVPSNIHLSYGSDARPF